MKIENEIYMLEIPVNIKGRVSVLNPTLIWDRDSLILIDAGFPCQLDEFKKAFSAYLFELKPINRLKICVFDGNVPSRRIAENFIDMLVVYEFMKSSAVVG